MINEASYTPPEAYTPEPEPLERRPGSRFGDKEAIVETMNRAEESQIEDLGEIGTLYPETTPPHMNVVHRVTIKGGFRQKDFEVDTETFEEEARDRNKAHHVVIHDPQLGSVECVFKPLDGENTQLKGEVALDEFYPQEAGTYIMDQAIDFDIVPPTVIRKINGRIGALQLFVPPEAYVPMRILRDQELPDGADNIFDDRFEDIMASEDAMKLAILDFIIGNYDRHGGNYLIRSERTEDGFKPVFNPDNSISIIGIDHGISFSLHDYQGAKEISGPALNLTYERSLTPGRPGTPLALPIPHHLLDKLRASLDHRQEVTEDLLDLKIPPYEIDYAWQRVKALVETGYILSPMNFSQFSSNVTQGEAHPHPPLRQRQPV